MPDLAFHLHLVGMMSERHRNIDQKVCELAPWQRLLHAVIFEADTASGKLFDVALLIAIVLSVLAVMLESVREIRECWGWQLMVVEWVLTVLFTVEYAFRLACVGRPLRYAVSFFGIVDLLAIVPTYLSFVIVGSQSLIVIRALRLLRVFRVYKLARYLIEARALVRAFQETRVKITVFLAVIMTVVLIMGSAMYLIEGERSGFTSIPRGVYWAIVTMTTVGYGDIYPETVVGQTLASVAMILGYSMIIVPTGIFSVEIITAHQRGITTQICPNCSGEGHDVDAAHCKYCGARL